MQKNNIIKIVLILVGVFLFLVIGITLKFGNLVRYSIADNCYNNKKWNCAIDNFKRLDKLNYKDSHEKLVKSENEKKDTGLKIFDSYNSLIGEAVMQCFNASNSKYDIDSVNNSINICQKSQEAILQTKVPNFFNLNLQKKIKALNLLYSDLCYERASFDKFAYNSMIAPSKETLIQIKKKEKESDEKSILMSRIKQSIINDIEYSTDTYLNINIEPRNHPYIDLIQKNDLEVIKAYNCSDEYGFGKYACGVLKNNTALAYYDVTLTFDLIDNQGNIISETNTQLKKMAPHATWKFKAMIWDKDATSWELSNITYGDSGY